MLLPLLFGGILEHDVLEDGETIQVERTNQSHGLHKKKKRNICILCKTKKKTFLLGIYPYFGKVAGVDLK